MATANVTQVNVRWYADDNADPDSMTALAAQNATLSRQMGTSQRVVGRILVQNDNSALWNTAAQWEWQNVTQSTGWQNLTASSTHVKTTGGTPTDGTLCDASILTGGTGTFEGEGTYNESNGAVTGYGIAKNNYCEFAVCLYLDSAYVANGDTVQIRLNGAAVTAWTNVLTLTADSSVTELGAASLNATATVAAAGSHDHNGVANISGTATVAAAGTVPIIVAASITGTATVAAAATLTHIGERVVTVASSGGHYTGLQAAFAGEAGYNCVLNQGHLRIRCQNFVDVTPVNLSAMSSAIVTNTTHYVIVEVVGAPGIKWSTAAYRLVPTSGQTAFDGDPDKVAHLETVGLQIDVGSMATAPRKAFDVGGATGTNTDAFIRHINYVIVGPGAGVSAYLVDMNQGSTSLGDGYYHINGVIYGATNATGVGFRSNSSASSYLYNCLIDDCDDGIAVVSGDVTVKNTRVTGCVSTGSGTLNAASNNNLTDGSALTNWGVNSLDSSDTPTISYVDDNNATLTSRDYHIQSSDSGIGAGQDLRNDASFAFAYDGEMDHRS